MQKKYPYTFRICETGIRWDVVLTNTIYFNHLKLWIVDCYIDIYKARMSIIAVFLGIY